MSPLVVLMLIFSEGPICFSFYMSLTEWKLSGVGHFIGLRNFQELFLDDITWLELKNFMVYMVFKVPSGVAISMVLAYFLNQKVPFKGVFRVIYFGCLHRSVCAPLEEDMPCFRFYSGSWWKREDG